MVGERRRHMLKALKNDSVGGGINSTGGRKLVLVN